MKTVFGWAALFTVGLLCFLATGWAFEHYPALACLTLIALCVWGIWHFSRERKPKPPLRLTPEEHAAIAQQDFRASTGVHDAMLGGGGYRHYDWPADPPESIVFGPPSYLADPPAERNEYTERARHGEMAHYIQFGGDPPAAPAEAPCAGDAGSAFDSGSSGCGDAGGS